MLLLFLKDVHMLSIQVHPCITKHRLPLVKRGFPLRDSCNYDLSTPSGPPNFTMYGLKARIPLRLWERNTAKSMSYFVQDIVAIATLSYGVLAVDCSYLWPFYWLAQGSFFWALFNIGHDCGHRSFSGNNCLNDLIGLISHSFLLVPFHGFRLSHKIHHTFHAHPEKDESWKPLSISVDEHMIVRCAKTLFRTQFPFTLLSFPAYLWFPVSHFNPCSRFFSSSDKSLVLASNACIFLFSCLLCQAMNVVGVGVILKLYFAPYLVFSAWISAVSYLHHHGSPEGHRIPWYRGGEWSYLRGSLSTVDRDYGIFNALHHNIGTHVVHHIFPQIPHYNLVEATECIKGVMGTHYREPEKCRGWFPTHLLKPLLHSFRHDHVVPHEGNIVYYESL